MATVTSEATTLGEYKVDKGVANDVDDGFVVDMSDQETHRWPTAAIAASSAKAAKGADLSPFVLNGVNLKLKRGQVCGIVGETGCGKTTLVHALLGETTRTGGEPQAAGSRGALAPNARVGFVPQAAFIMSATVEDNIFMGRPVDRLRLTEVIRDSAMERDITLLSEGLDTMIGERGVTLSGGQKQRLAIARALYGRPDVLILDDPLAAVDGIVAEQIFTSAVLNAARRDGAAVVMTLNQLHFLPRFDHVLLLEQGRVVEAGGFNELCDLPDGRLAAAWKTSEEFRTAGAGEGADEEPEASSADADSAPSDNSTEIKPKRRSTQVESPADEGKATALVTAEVTKEQGAVSMKVVKQYING
jgi:ABC-type glutathione transport system ATPase component